MIRKYFFTKSNVLIVIGILIIIIAPINAREESGVEPDYGSIYFGFYNYYINIPPKEVNTAQLKIYLPAKVNWKDDCVLTKNFKPDRDKNRTECRLDENDYDEILKNWRDLREKYGTDNQKEKFQLTTIGIWRYEFIINGISKGVQDGQDIILIWVTPEYDISAEIFTVEAYLNGKDLPVDVFLKLKYDKEEKFKEYISISQNLIKDRSDANRWKKIIFMAEALPKDLRSNSGLSQDQIKGITLDTILDVKRKG